MGHYFCHDFTCKLSHETPINMLSVLWKLCDTTFEEGFDDLAGETELLNLIGKYSAMDFNRSMSEPDITIDWNDPVNWENSQHSIYEFKLNKIVYYYT